MNSKRTLCSMAVFAAALLLTTATAVAQDFIAPPKSLPGGLSYQQWSAKWWQWAWSIPSDINPILDKTGANCDVDQSGPVWYLAGTAGFDTERACTIPAGKMIFFPIINLGNDYPCLNLTVTPPGQQRKNPIFQPGPGQSLEQFLTIGYGPLPDGTQIGGARQAIDHVTAVSASLDGVPVRDLTLPPETSIYRATSPMFVFQGDRSLLTTFDNCVGPGHKAVSDGYWIMLKPLSPGSHNLIFSGTETFPGFSFTVTVTYDLTIV
jgi:hypothetical protein